MDSLLSILPYIQIALAIILIGAILMQQRGAGLGGAFGGGGEGTVHYERRGFEKTLFKGTIALAIIFVAASALPLFTTPVAPAVIPEETPVLDNITIETEDGEATIDNDSIVVESVPVEETTETPAN